MPSSISPMEYRDRVEQGQTSLMLVNLSVRKTRHVLVREFVFAEDTVFVAHNYQDILQKIITCFSKSAKALGLKINL